jgi:hypothetical protein
MKKLLVLILMCSVKLSYNVSVLAQSDSIIRFSDLKFQNDFEKKAVEDFVKYKKDTFNLFFSIDENITEKDARLSQVAYQRVLKELENSKIRSRKINQQIKSSYSEFHSRFLKKYNSNEYFPQIFLSGTYNCVTGSMLYAMVFEYLGIPYKVKASSNHVYLVANPGSSSVVVETTNPGFEQQIFTGEFKQQYVNYLRSSKLISDAESKSKSVEEIFEEKFNEVKDAEFCNLAGMQYYNKALSKYQNNKIDDALVLSQKAFFFYPEYQARNLLYVCLFTFIDKCSFNKVSDIDYLAQLSRFEETDINTVVAIFNNIIERNLQYTNKDAFCDSLNLRLISELSDKKLIDEINFNYNMQMSYRYQNSEKVEKYIARALSIKDNHHDAQIIMENHLRRKLYSITEADVLLDTISQMEKRYTLEIVTSALQENKLRAYLEKADDLFTSRKATEGNKYLLEFEKACVPPVTSKLLISSVESAYDAAASYYTDYKGDKATSKSYIRRGIKYAPNSRYLQSALQR